MGLLLAGVYADYGTFQLPTGSPNPGATQLLHRLLHHPKLNAVALGGIAGVTVTGSGNPMPIMGLFAA
jgi:hypothetical protein